MMSGVEPFHLVVTVLVLAAVVVGIWYLIARIGRKKHSSTPPS
jgi:hypothetical protein